MSTYQKFDFSPINDPHDFQPIRRKKVLGEEDLQAAREEGYMEGQNSELAKATKQTAESMRAIAHMMQMILGKLNQESTELRQDAVEVAINAAKAIAGVALENNGMDSILEYIHDATSNLRNTPRIIIKVPTEQKETLENHILQTVRDSGFDGQVEIRADDDARIGDCSLEWQDGAIRHNREETLNKIEQSAKHWLQSADQAETQMNLFG